MYGRGGEGGGCIGGVEEVEGVWEGWRSWRIYGREVETMMHTCTQECINNVIVSINFEL